MRLQEFFISSWLLSLFRSSSAVENDMPKQKQLKNYLLPKNGQFTGFCNLIGKWKDSSGTKLTIIANNKINSFSLVEVHIHSEGRNYLGGVQLQQESFHDIALPVLLKQSNILNKTKLAMITCATIDDRSHAYLTLIPSSDSPPKEQPKFYDLLSADVNKKSQKGTKPKKSVGKKKKKESQTPDEVQLWKESQLDDEDQFIVPQKVSEKMRKKRKKQVKQLLDGNFISKLNNGQDYGTNNDKLIAKIDKIFNKKARRRRKQISIELQNVEDDCRIEDSSVGVIPLNEEDNETISNGTENHKSKQSMKVKKSQPIMQKKSKQEAQKQPKKIEDSQQRYKTVEIYRQGAEHKNINDDQHKLLRELIKELPKNGSQPTFFQINIRSPGFPKKQSTKRQSTDNV